MTEAFGGSINAIGGIDPAERHLPPVALLATVSLAIAVTDGIVIAAYIPRMAPHALTLGLAGVGIIMLLVALAILFRIQPFAWRTFFTVAKWALLAYVIETGMIEYVLIHNHVRGFELIILTVLLLLFALDVPCIISFTVARYQEVNQASRA